MKLTAKPKTPSGRVAGEYVRAANSGLTVAKMGNSGKQVTISPARGGWVLKSASSSGKVAPTGSSSGRFISNEVVRNAAHAAMKSAISKKK